MTFSKFATSVFLFLALGSSAFAADLEWTGSYRIEGNFIKDSELSSNGYEKDYGLHHLILRPKIVAGDGLTIYSQFHLFNAGATAGSPYYNSQIGQFFGNGPSGSANVNESNSLGDTQKAEMLQISQLYLSLTQEYGAFVAGRVPLQFGLGMTHNAGNGMFDHWYDSRDLVGYKFVMGNLYFLPMFGKKSEGTLNRNDDVNSYMFHFQYDNFETDISMGVFYETNKANDQGSDGPNAGATPFPGAAGGTRSELNERNINIFVLKDTDRFRLGLEAGFQSGDVGLTNAGGEKISWDGFGLAGELEYRPEGSKWKFGTFAGYATGDNPDTTSKYEGYVFDRNYDVAFLMFNHQLGQNDFLGTRSFGGGGNTTGNADADVESIANVMYLSPYLHYGWSDKWALKGVLTTGWLSQSPIANQDVAKSLGYEIDLAIEFSPSKTVKWINQMGYVIPGDAFKGGTLGYDTNSMFGLTSKAAISF